jgi:uncharacterized protein DUF3352
MSSVHIRSVVVIMLAGVVLATGCGGSTTASSGSSQPAAAVPAGALAYADVNLDHNSTAWKQFASVGKRFPGWQLLVDNAIHSFDNNRTGSTYEHDIQPWLGNSAGAAVTSVDLASRTPNWVVFVASTDDGLAKDAVDGGDTHSDGEYNGYSQYVSTSDNAEIGVGNGAVIIANNTQTLHDAIDVRDGKAESLADVSQFKDAMSALPQDSLVRGYANPSAIAQLASLAQLSGPDPATAQQLQTFAQSLSWMDSASVAMLATPGGYNTVFHVRIKDGADPGVYGSQLSGDLTLTSLVPADAFLFVGSKLTGDAFKKALDQSLNGAGAGQLNQLEQITGLSFANDIAPLFSGELLLYAAPGLPVRGALLLKPSDPDAAAAGLRHIMAFAARAQPGLRIHDLSGGREGQSLEVSPGFTFTWERKPGGLIAIGNDTAAGTDPGQALVESPDYTSLLAKADVPDGATVAAYVSIPGILKLVPTEIDPNLRPLGGVLEWSSRNGNDLSIGVFVEVK